MVAVLLAALGAAGLALHHAGGALPSDSRADADDPYAAFCTPVPPGAVVPAGVAADHVLAVQVPLTTPPVPILDGAAALPVPVRRGQIVEFRVASARAGAVAVHGLSEIVRLRVGEPGVVRFRALYSGRFPLHFHGADQSHFEVAVLEVRG